MEVIIIKSGSSHASLRNKYGDFDQLIKQRLLKQNLSTTTITIQHQPPLPEPKSTGAVIITGAHEDVTDNSAWMIYLAHWIRELFRNNTPLLGICFGHQIIAKALGGKVGDNPNGGEFGLIEVYKHKDLNENPLMFQTPLIYAYASHCQTVLELPPGAKSLAFSHKDINQMVRYSPYCWGVQFHPEFNRNVVHEYWRRNGRMGTCGKTEQNNLAAKAGENLLNSFIQLALQKTTG